MHALKCTLIYRGLRPACEAFSSAVQARDHSLAIRFSNTRHDRNCAAAAVKVHRRENRCRLRSSCATERKDLLHAPCSLPPAPTWRLRMFKDLRRRSVVFEKTRAFCAETYAEPETQAVIYSRRTQRKCRPIHSAWTTISGDHASDTSVANGLGTTDRPNQCRAATRGSVIARQPSKVNSAARELNYYRLEAGRFEDFVSYGLKSFAHEGVI